MLIDRGECGLCLCVVLIYRKAPPKGSFDGRVTRRQYSRPTLLLPLRQMPARHPTANNARQPSPTHTGHLCRPHDLPRPAKRAHARAGRGGGRWRLRRGWATPRGRRMLIGRIVVVVMLVVGALALLLVGALTLLLGGARARLLGGGRALLLGGRAAARGARAAARRARARCSSFVGSASSSHSATDCCSSRSACAGSRASSPSSAARARASPSSSDCSASTRLTTTPRSGEYTHWRPLAPSVACRACERL